MEMYVERRAVTKFRRVFRSTSCSGELVPLGEVQRPSVASDSKVSFRVIVFGLLSILEIMMSSPGVSIFVVSLGCHLSNSS